MYGMVKVLLDKLQSVVKGIDAVLGFFCNLELKFVQ